MRNFKLLLPLLFFVLACRGDRGDQLFIINYPPIDFDLPAGIGFPNSWVVTQEVVNSRLQSSIDDAGVSADQITAIGGAFARLSSLDGNDYRDLQSVSVRICPVGTAICSEADEIFFLGDLVGRRNTLINLNPGLRNVQLLVETGRFKLELVLTPAQTTRATIASRFEFSLEAVQ